LKLLPAHMSLFEWLCNLPHSVVQDVVVDLLAEVDVLLATNKLEEDLFSYSMLSVVQGFELKSLKFSHEMTFFWRIHSMKLVEDSLCLILPGLASLTSLNISDIATDRMLYTVSKYLPSLISLELSESQVTDHGLRYLAGANSVTVTNLKQVKVRSLNTSLVGEADHDYKQEGCIKLRHIDLEFCEKISETGLKILIKHLSSLRCVGFLGVGTRLTPLSEHMMTKLFTFTPHLTTITLETNDKALYLLAMCPNLISITVELEDCLGMGFIQFLEQRGARLVEVDMTYLDGEEGPDIQQGQFVNLAIVSVGQLAINLRKLSLSGSGPVSYDAAKKMELEDKIGNSSWMRSMADSWFRSLESLRMNSYDTIINICPKLLKSVLVAAKTLSVLDLEGSFVEPLTDAYIGEIVSVNPLSSLSTLYISGSGSTPLTVSTVKLLLSKCTCLKDFDISYWNVTNQQFKEVESIVKKNNWDLEIIGRKEMEGN